MRDKFIKFMYGRYGVDEFGKCLLVTAIIVSFFGMIINMLFKVAELSFLCSLLSTLLMVYIIYRTFSRNINKRVLENHKFLKRTSKIRNWFKFCKTRYTDRKIYRYVKCPNCKNYSRVPRGKGKIKITCRVCKKNFDKSV